MHSFKKGTYNKYNWLNNFRGGLSPIYKYKNITNKHKILNCVKFFFLSWVLENFKGLVLFKPPIYFYGVHSQFFLPIYHWHYISYDVGHTCCFLRCTRMPSWLCALITGICSVRFSSFREKRAEFSFRQLTTSTPWPRSSCMFFKQINVAIGTFGKLSKTWKRARLNAWQKTRECFDNHHYHQENR